MTRLQLIGRNLWLFLRSVSRDWWGIIFLVYWLSMMAYAYWLLSYFFIGIPAAHVLAFVIVVLLGGRVLIVWANRRNAKDALRLSANAEQCLGERIAQRAQLAQELLRAAVLVDRAACEAVHRNGKLAPEHYGISRRRTLAIAQRPELWERFPPAERDLLIAQEGSWPWDSVWPRLARIEDVRVLRWALGMDAILTPFEFLTQDLRPAFAISTQPSLVDGDRCLNPWDLRPARNMANAMFHRCIAEGVQRGFFQVGESEGRADFLALAERMGADPGSDVLIGTATVSGATEQQIRWTAQMAQRRSIVLTAVIEFLGGDSTLDLAIPT